MSVTALAPRFPAVSFASQAEFEEYRRSAGDRLDARHRYERELASAETEVTFSGTCGPCLRPTLYTSRTAGVAMLPDGGRVPNWREELVCGCEDRLNARYRAMLHFCESVTGVLPATRILAFGPPSPMSRRLGKMAQIVHRPRMNAADGAHRIDLPDASVHLATSADYLHQVPPLDAALAELRRVLVPSGQLVFTVPFRFDLAASVSRTDRFGLRGNLLPVEDDAAVHEFGWDLLRRLRSAGFAQALAHTYWSEELGYLGPFNMIFAATA